MIDRQDKSKSLKNQIYHVFFNDSKVFIIIKYENIEIKPKKQIKTQISSDRTFTLKI